MRDCVTCGKPRNAHDEVGRCYPDKDTPVYGSMDLPAGRTCADCRFVGHCTAMYSVKPGNTWCDFYPVRFHPSEGAP